MISAYSGVADAFAGAGPGALAALRAASPRPAGLEAANEPYPELDVERDEAHGALWCYLRPAGPPSFTPGVLRDLHALHARIRAELAEPGRPRIRYYVQASRLPGIFNMGATSSSWASACAPATGRACGLTPMPAWRRPTASRRGSTGA